jgi:hypothetical protein
MSTRAQAELLGVDHSTVTRDQQVSGGADAPPENPPKVEGRDGKQYPRKRARKPELDVRDQRIIRTE